MNEYVNKFVKFSNYIDSHRVFPNSHINTFDYDKGKQRIHFAGKGGVTIWGKEIQSNISQSNESTISLKGTFIAVMLLGVFILVSWFGFYALFLSR